MSRSRFHRSTGLAVKEARAIDPTGTWTGWTGPLLEYTGVVPPHGYDYLNRAGVEVSTKTVLGIGAVQRCIEVIQNAHFFMGPPRPYRLGWDEDGISFRDWIPGNDRTYPSILNGPWGTSPLADNAPVPYNVGAGRTLASMGLFGEAWWLCTSRDYQGNMAALEVLHPSFLEFKPDKTVWYGTSNSRVEVDIEDLVHIPRLILPGDRSGLNPIKTQSSIFAIAIAAVQYSQMWFAQGGQPGFIFTTDQKLDNDDIDRIFEHILLEKMGLQHAYTPLIVDSGIKPAFTQIDPEKSQMNATLAYVREEMGGYFGLPLHLIGASGDSGNVWGKGIQEQGIQMNMFTFSGYRVPYEEAFTQIIPRGIYAGLNWRVINQSNALDMSKLTQARRMGAVTSPDEERREYELKPMLTAKSKSISTPMNSNQPAPMDDSGGDAGEGGDEG